MSDLWGLWGLWGRGVARRIVPGARRSVVGCGRLGCALIFDVEILSAAVGLSCPLGPRLSGSGAHFGRDGSGGQEEGGVSHGGAPDSQKKEKVHFFAYSVTELVVCTCRGQRQRQPTLTAVRADCRADT